MTQTWHQIPLGLAQGWIVTHTIWSQSRVNPRLAQEVQEGVPPSFKTVNKMIEDKAPKRMVMK